MENGRLERLLNIMEILRSMEGCPWDREQTHQSLKKYFIEETYEYLEAVDLDDKGKMCEELGDVLLQVVFHAQIAKENGDFSMEDVINGVCDKMIHRHPHVFGNVNVKTSGEVLRNWEEIKKKEKGNKNQTSVLKDVPANLPALMRSYKVQQKAAQIGFDWDNTEDVFAKIREEIDELEEEFKKSDKKGIEDELGDVLFSIVNLSRFLKVHPELTLSQSTDKFIRRFEIVEQKASELGRNINEMTLLELDVLWKEAKMHKYNKNG
ncbi:tetrapyrrole methylase family protein/MazG family protein [Ruminiclostridium sufflavum DSM 19573]|uniref:Tetrapyrrole methylase family protein/MazG family protein n=1 Tax=Ruminiclostridium sufflavum DSM 19573 TaxID=1121337 RepID=A0A318XL59_9FIRM|nr:nucleoside triphosphate pyrophosphohydrolase [Ruminiclostridium sufflavum]PYG88263.1 tetrapyrrole methylase family protein/MazG family protein [Ruminiclostridium sufflavum DSM 19573]